MKLFDYLWDMFKIAKGSAKDPSDDVDVSVGRQKFYTNCEEGRAVYIGAPNLDYEMLKIDYDATKNLAEQKKWLQDICNGKFGKYEELCKAFREGDRKTFDAIVDEYEAKCTGKK